MNTTNEKGPPFTEAEIIQLISRELPRLILQNPEIRYEVIGVMAEVFAKKDELTAVLNELKQLHEDSEQRWLDFRNELKQLRQDFEQHRLEYLQEIKALREDFKALRTDVNKELKPFGDTVQGLGARWGLMSEAAFRSGLAAILTDELGFQVEKFHSYDNSGTVFGHPDQVELDVVIRNGLVIAIEIKSSISRGDLATLQRKIAFYEQTTGARVDRKFVISPFVEPGAAELAERLGMEIYTHSSEVTI